MPVARLRPISSHVAAVDLYGRFQVAAFLVRHSAGLVAIDAGFPGWGYAILTAAQSLPAPNRITHLILTHSHCDHIGGASTIAQESGAKVLCSETERPFIEERRSLGRAARGIFSRGVLTLNHWVRQRQVPPVHVDAVVHEGDELLGLRVVELAGHTPGQIALVHQADRVVLCADALFNVGGRLGHDPVPGITADTKRADASIARLVELGIDDIAPSHGPALMGDALPRLRDFLARRGYEEVGSLYSAPPCD